MNYTLSNASGTATFDTLGGELISYKNKDSHEYVWCGDKNYWTGHGPVLFPIVGALKNNTTTIDGKEYKINKHGFARKTEFALLNQTSSSIEFILKDSEATLAVYPYHFELVVKHELNEDGFSTTYYVKNTNDKEMYFSVGGHLGLSFMKAGESFSDYYLLFDKAEDSAVYTDSDSITHRDYKVDYIKDNKADLNYSDFDHDVLILEDLKSSCVKLLKKGADTGIEFKMNGFKSLGVWTPPLKKAPFVCLEPWCGLPDYTDSSCDFKKKPGVVSVMPGETFEVGYSMKLI